MISRLIADILLIVRRGHILAIWDWLEMIWPVSSGSWVRNPIFVVSVIRFPERIKFKTKVAGTYNMLLVTVNPRFPVDIRSRHQKKSDHVDIPIYSPNIPNTIYIYFFFFHNHFQHDLPDILFPIDILYCRQVSGVQPDRMHFWRRARAWERAMVLLDGLFHGKSYENGWFGGTPMPGTFLLTLKRWFFSDLSQWFPMNLLVKLNLDEGAMIASISKGPW